MEASSSGESDGDGDAPAPAPAAAASEQTKKCSGKCKKTLPQSAYSQTQWKKGSGRKCENCKGSGGGKRKAARSNEEAVPIYAIITAGDQEKDSVSVPGDALKRSVRVRHIINIRRNEDNTPEDKVRLATHRWLFATTTSKPERMWSVVNAETGDKIGEHVIRVAVSIDKVGRRAIMTLDSLTAALRTHQLGAISHSSLRPLRSDQGTTTRRFLTGNAESGVKLFCETYRNDNADVLERKCSGTALPSDNGVVVEAAKSRFPVKLKGKYAQVESELVILQSTIVARGGGSTRGWLFVADNEKDARALCLRSDIACVLSNLNAPLDEILRQIDERSLFKEDGLLEGVPHDPDFYDNSIWGRTLREDVRRAYERVAFDVDLPAPENWRNTRLDGITSAAAGVEFMSNGKLRLVRDRRRVFEPDQLDEALAAARKLSPRLQLREAQREAKLNALRDVQRRLDGDAPPDIWSADDEDDAPNGVDVGNLPNPTGGVLMVPPEDELTIPLSVAHEADVALCSVSFENKATNPEFLNDNSDANQLAEAKHLAK